MEKITITFPEIKINIDYDSLNLDTLEEVIFNTSQESARAVMIQTLEKIDTILKEKRPKGEFENSGKRIKHFLTRMGAIIYKRTRYFERATGKYRYLLEEKLGLRPDQRVSMKRQQIEMMIVTSFPYREVQRILKLITGCSRSHEATRQSVLAEGKKIRQHEKQSIMKIKTLKERPAIKAPEVVYHEVDSVFIKYQRSKKRKYSHKRQITQKKLPRNRKRKHSIEIKLGIGYTGKTKRYPNGARLAERLENKFTFCGISGGAKFMEDLSLISDKRFNLSLVKQVILGGDGASWIRRGGKDYFVGALYILCRFHLNRTIKRALPKRKDNQKILRTFLEKDAINEALSYIMNLSNSTKDPKEKEALDKLYVYIRQNRQGINSLQRIADPVVRAKAMNTGTIESNVDKFVAHRFKKRGMSWSRDGALALLKIKQILANEQWEDWWNNDRQMPIKIHREIFKTISKKDIDKPIGIRDSLVKTSMPVLEGPHQDRCWVEMLRRLSAQKSPAEWSIV